MDFLMFILITKKYLTNKHMLGVNESNSRFEFNTCGVSIYVCSAYIWNHQKNEKQEI